MWGQKAPPKHENGGKKCRQNAKVEAVDKGALDCTVRARTVAAIYRAAQRSDYRWEV